MGYWVAGLGWLGGARALSADMNVLSVALTIGASLIMPVAAAQARMHSR